MSWLTLRVGESFTDLRNYNRVSVEVIGPRGYLVGTLKSGRPMALYAVRAECSIEDVSEAIEKALGGGRSLVVLTRELVELDKDEHARAVLEEYAEALATPNTLTSALADARRDA